MTTTATFESWPELRVSDWEQTRDTVHMWSQIVGKTRMALAPNENHWWQVALYVNSVGLTTSLMPYDGYGVEIVFDFADHVLDITTTKGERRQVRLEPRTTADFYADYLAQLESLGISVPIYDRPVEVAESIPFAQDTTHASYDADAVKLFWHQLVSAQRVFAEFRGKWRGKCSPVHFFWGSFDLAVTRFSGRPAPLFSGVVPNCPERVMVESYCEEVSSAGFWPGGADEGAFYSYSYPVYEGYPDAKVHPAAASYDTTLGEFLLPYTAVRTADDSDASLREFLQSTFDVESSLGEWP
ncbi:MULTISPECIES: DUF5996 family protein [Gordonia]|uniref:Ava_C0101 and related proteins n=2 Tax=Gordonia TaxID=2053 RepID=H5U5E6_9ACTN|nr:MULTISPECIES: DUF5996 family protein [Gordonia]MCM3894331.1 DUF5996 family protein [Gordonia sputi]NKY94166.1 hypothetical protein [Gordonia sputi]OBA37206.1 hypothetical protein A5766_07005 [Gordonia sp. 852002-51296_SCH5728562-b]GAB40954.1 hypothetical protein GOSPT_118_00300 [Gordonia sputi NBRC 100414]